MDNDIELDKLCKAHLEIEVNRFIANAARYNNIQDIKGEIYIPVRLLLESLIDAPNGDNNE